MEYKLEYHINDELKTLYLHKDVISIGKLSSNDLQLFDNSVSRTHCQIEKTDIGYKVKDMNSTNGTFVNGKRIQEKILKIGDNITIGRTIIKYLGVSKEESYYDVDDQKISMVIPLSDEFRIEKEKKVAADELAFLTSLTALGKTLITSTTLEDSFEKVANLVTKFIKPQHLYVFFYDETQTELQLKHSHTMSKTAKEEKVNISKTIAMKAVKEKVAILSANTKDDARFDGAKSIIMYGITSAISVPIWTKNSIYGLLYADTTQFDQMFKEKDVEIMSVIANFTGLAVEGINSLNKLNKEKKIRARLERYHSPAVVSRIMESPDENTMELASYKETEASVLFMDIVSFTSRVENMSPAEVGIFLNNFFTEMTEIIFKYNGTLDKYIGDSIMAVFGAPFELENHEEMAIMAALDMLKKLKSINKNFPENESIRIRIGINAGKLISGDFGSPQRYDYTVIGNTVNVASRLESEVAGSDEVVVSEVVYQKTQSLFEYESLGEKKLQGLSKGVKTFKVIKVKGK